MGNSKKDSGSFGNLVNKVVHLDETVYHIPVDIFIGNHEEYAKYIYKTFKIEEEVPKSGFAGESNLFENNSVVPKHFVSVIWLDRFNWTTRCYEVLAHEVIHCVWGILHVAGVKVRYNNQEPLAYLFSSIYEGALTKLRALDKREIAKKCKLKKRKK